MSLNTIYEPVRGDLARVRDLLESVTKVGVPWLSELLEHSLMGGGKGIRPALTLLSAKFYDYNLDPLLPMAAAVELMHTATLVHDDAIDKSAVRRGRPTINKLWGEDKAVLLGDYLFAKAGEFCASTGNLRVITLFSQTLATISSGELDQTFHAFKLEQSRQQYLDRIARKTASLFSLATESGAILSQAPEKSVKLLVEYGHDLGIAFQIVDDILDFVGSEEEMGKPIGSDLAQGTITLPAMLLLELYPDNNPIKRLFQYPNETENIKLAIEQVRNSPVVQKCYDAASDYTSRARRNLSLLPDNITRQALMELANYVVSRNR